MTPMTLRRWKGSGRTLPCVVPVSEGQGGKPRRSSSLFGIAPKLSSTSSLRGKVGRHVWTKHCGSGWHRIDRRGSASTAYQRVPPHRAGGRRVKRLAQAAEGPVRRPGFPAHRHCRTAHRHGFPAHRYCRTAHRHGFPAHRHCRTAHRYGFPAHRHCRTAHRYGFPAHRHCRTAHRYGFPAHRHCRTAHRHGFPAHRHCRTAHRHGLPAHGYGGMARDGGVGRSSGEGDQLDHGGTLAGS